VQNPLRRAKAWERMRILNPKLSLRRLAAREGVFPATLVQHFKLLKLAPEIQDFMAIQEELEVLRFFSLRRLMSLADLSTSEQRKVFRVWQVEWGKTASNPTSKPTVALIRSAHGAAGPRPF